jgi:hypothetical protein
VTQLVACITAVSKDVAQPWIKPADRGQYSDGTILILDAGDMHDQSDEMAGRVGDNVLLAANDLLPASKPRVPPPSVVLTDWLSMTPAVGLACRPASRATPSPGHG